MGGYGSGRQARRATVEETLSFPVSSLHREGVIRPGWVGTVFWRAQEPDGPRLATIVVAVTTEQEIIIIDRVTGADQAPEILHYPVRIGWTPCRFGGERPWWLCPGRGCGRRVARLYLAGRYLLCRHCCGLTYASRQASGTIWRPRQRIMTLRRRLGTSAVPPLGFECSDWGMDRPRHMHRRTYRHLLRQLAAAQENEAAMFTARMSALAAVHRVTGNRRTH